MIKKGNSFLILYANDLDKTQEFYKKLGVEIKEHDSRKLVFTIGDLELHFNTDEPIKEYSFVMNEMSKSRGLIFGLEVDNIYEYFTKLESMNAEIISPIIQAPWETKEFMVNDPNGYHIVFWQEI